VLATAADVGPWIAKLRQGRSGFYASDALENLLGCEIHTADRIVPEWREVVVGAEEEVLRMSWPVCRTTDNLPCRSGDLDPSLIVLGSLCVASWPPVSHSRCSKRAG
jgi:hypothetical protein